MALAIALVALTASGARAATLRVFAAASLSEAFQDLGALYRSQNPGQEVEFNFAGSQILRTQIEEGASADVFVSADHVHMDALKAKGLAASDELLARNRLVVVTPRSTPKVHGLGDLARPGIRVVVADANVPVGRYTTQVLGKMNRASIFGDDFQRRVNANVVSQETNVRAVLAKVSLDEVDAGFVYATDAQTAAEKVLALPIPESMNVIAEYPIATLKNSVEAELATKFVALALSDEGQGILQKRGFQLAK